MSDYETARAKLGITVNELQAKGYDVPEGVLGGHATAAMQRQIDFILNWRDNLPNEAEVAIAHRHLHDIGFKLSDLDE